MQKALKRMGVQQQDIDAEQVIITCADKDIVITQPTVAKVNLMGQETWQITGQAIERVREVAITAEDIQTVMEQAKVSEDVAKKAIFKHHGDLAAAILELTGQ